jgi:Cytidylate kinase-like family
MTLVALSASYGARGSRIGPALAGRLDVPFVDRAIPAAVAERLAVPLDAAAAHDDQMGGSWLERILSGFIGQDAVAPAPVPARAVLAEDFRRATEDVLLNQAATGMGVILGRASVIVLRDDPRALRVRLDGPAPARVAHAMRLEGVDEPTAQRRVRQLDRTHADYARHFYRMDIADPSLYHVVLDSTAIAIDSCVEMLVAAARALGAARQRR